MEANSIVNFSASSLSKECLAQLGIIKEILGERDKFFYFKSDSIVFNHFGLIKMKEQSYLKVDTSEDLQNAPFRIIGPLPLEVVEGVFLPVYNSISP